MSSGNAIRPLTLLIYAVFGICMIFLINRALLQLFPLDPITYKVVNVYYSLTDKNNDHTTNVTVSDILRYERERIVSEMDGFNHTEKKFDVTSLTPEAGGRPIRTGEYWN